MLDNHFWKQSTFVWLCSRHLVGSTNQASSSGFYSWKSTERPSFLWNRSLSFLRGLRTTLLFNIQKVRGIFLIIEIRVTFGINEILKIEIFWGHEVLIFLIFEAGNFWRFWGPAEIEGMILKKTRLFCWVSSNSELEATWTSLIGWRHLVQCAQSLRAC